MTKPYIVVPNEENPLLHTFGDACVPVENYVYHFMSKMAGDAYAGGMWEFRKYPNGALMMVFPDDTVIDPHTLNGNYVTCSLEALSASVWLIVLSMLNMDLANKKSSLADVLSDQYHAGLDALYGEYRFVIDPTAENGTRAVLEGEELPAEKHPEIKAIGSILD